MSQAREPHTRTPDPFRRPSTRSGNRSGRRHSTATTTGTTRPTSPALDLERAFAAAAATAPPAAKSFAALGLPDRLVIALDRRGVQAPFAIQARTIPDALAGRDVLGRAQTGSGKTLAFGLPLLARIAGEGRVPGKPRGLVLVPTRELAEQVKEVLAPLGQALDVRVTAVYGGASMRRQIDALRRGADVVIATPGRLVDLIGQGECSLDRVSITVLDEADYMADLGFLPVVTELLGQTQPDAQRLLFSATLDKGVDKIVARFLTAPAMHAVESAVASVTTMDHRAFTVRAEDKLAVTAEIAARPGRTLIFVRTKHGADRLAKQLQRTGVPAGAIHGNLLQNARQRALDAFSSGAARVLVATDVAARGIHVDDVDLVLHYDPPAEAKDYLHRSGRTARAGANGVVLSLLQPDQVRGMTRLYEQAGVGTSPAWVEPGSPAVREIASSGIPIPPVAVTQVATPPAPSGAARPRSQRPRSKQRSTAASGGSGARRPDRTPWRTAATRTAATG